ncbi:MAG: citrate transporter [Bacteroidetes bacterium OLB9]|nr:MAG: citrate transporter [Bacteroidetes bacterium OLB9]
MDLEGLSPEGKAVLASTLWVAVWWITEAVELSVAALLPVVLFPLSGALTLEQTTSAYGNPFIFLFLGGFIIGITIERWHLHNRIAYYIMRMIGSGERRLLLGIMLATAFISMWISNTATAIMMLPIGMAVATQYDGHRFGKSMMLGIAYAASIGGMATLIGTPPNVILAGIVQEMMDVNISFIDWMFFATPFSAILLILTWVYLSRGLKKSIGVETQFLIASPGPMSIAEKRTLWVFGLTAILWMTRTLLLENLIPRMDDTIIAMLGALMMFGIPAGNGKGRLLDWHTAKQLPWDVLLIFGGGLAIAKGFSTTDLTDWVALQFGQIHLNPIWVTLIVIASINFLTEITSNTATASIMLPLLVTLGISMGLDTLPLLIGATLAASCAFMLPVATPPNAIVFSSGMISIRDMMRAGLFLNIVSIALIFIFIYLFAHLIF